MNGFDVVCHAKVFPPFGHLVNMTLYRSVLILLAVGSVRYTLGITCADVIEKGSASVFKTEELQTLGTLMPDDLRQCTAFLGKEKLSSNQSFIIWSSFVEVYGGAELIPEDQLQQLGWVINGIPPSHYINISLTDVDTIASFGRCTELSASQLESLRNAVSEQWLGKTVEDFTSYDLSTLRQILCAYNSTLIQMIHPDTYRDAAHELATLTNCPLDVLKEFAQLAVDERAFGDPHGWTSVQISSVGCVMAGLPSISDIPSEAFEGITSGIIECFPEETFQAMTSEQISHLSPSAAAELSRRKSVVLSSDKKYSLRLALSSEGESKQSAATCRQQWNVVIVVTIVLLMEIYIT